MKTLRQESLSDYEEIQILRSRDKFDFCKVDYGMVLRFYNIIQKDLGNHDFDPKIVCLGNKWDYLFRMFF